MFEADIAAAFRSANPYDGPVSETRVRGFFHAAKKLECVMTDAGMLAMPKIMPLARTYATGVIPDITELQLNRCD
jgi:hypothetical protein